MVQPRQVKMDMVECKSGTYIVGNSYCVVPGGPVTFGRRLRSAQAWDAMPLRLCVAPPLSFSRYAPVSILRPRYHGPGPAVSNLPIAGDCGPGRATSPRP